MALSAGLQLRQSQSLVMTPQLMQSIRLLQFSHVELTRFIEQEVERNPLLELVSSDNDQSDPVSEAAEPAKPQAAEGDQGEDASWAGNADSQAERMTSEIDARYENVFPDDHGTERVDQPEFIDNWKSMPGNDGGRSGEGYDLDDFAARAPTLRDHVAEQIAFAFAEPAERLIATELADQLDAAGYMVGDMAETVERLSADPEQVEACWPGFRSSSPPACLPVPCPSVLPCSWPARTGLIRPWRRWSTISNCWRAAILPR
jgi:RNA polymerase sigma-54 factor